MFPRVWAFIGLLFLAACSSYGPPADLAGMSREQVIARMGQPDRQQTMIGGETRLEFPRGPYGHHTWFVTFAADGRAMRSEQVLTEQQFGQIVPGMDVETVRNRLGRPNEERTLGRARGVVWSYRYENPQCLWFQVEIAADRTVRSAGYGQPPECDHDYEIIIP